MVVVVAAAVVVVVVAVAMAELAVPAAVVALVMSSSSVLGGGRAWGMAVDAVARLDMAHVEAAMMASGGKRGVAAGRGGGGIAPR